MNTSDKPASIVRYQVQKDKVVRFACPACNELLNTQLKDANKKDNCPNCGIFFISPGAREVEAIKKAQQAKIELQEKQRALMEQKRQEVEASRAQEAESKRETTEPVVPPTKRTSAPTPPSRPAFEPVEEAGVTLESLSQASSEPIPSGLHAGELFGLAGSSAPGPNANSIATPPALPTTPHANTVVEESEPLANFQPLAPAKFGRSKAAPRVASTNSNYPALEFYIRLLRIFGYAFMVIGGLAAVVVVVGGILQTTSSSNIGAILTAWMMVGISIVIVAFWTFISVLPMFVGAELIRLLIDIRTDIGKLSKDEG